MQKKILTNSFQLPIWSLTQERVDKLKQQMLDKKEEHDTLKKLSEKDLWCQDLDDFIQEWENQLKEDAEYEKTIRNTNRRASRKIGAGKNVAKGRSKGDDEYNPKPLKANPNKGVVKVENKPHQRFLEMFSQKPKPKPNNSGFGSDGVDEPDSGMSDDDFAELASKPASKKTSRGPSEQPENGRVRRAAAAAPKKWVEDDEESESDDGKLLGDVGDMVKGIGGGDDNIATNGRVSLFAMSRPDSSHGRPTSSSGLPKAKAKASKPFDLSDGDETNYEMLARSSPHKAAPAPKDNLDSFLSDEDDLPTVTKKAPVKAALPKPVAKPAPKPEKAAPVSKKGASASSLTAQPKPVTLSPAAKAYAAKQNKLKQPAPENAMSDEEEDSDVRMDDSPPPKPAARGRPARAAAAKPKKAIYIDSDDEDMDMDDIDESAVVEEDESEEGFDDDD